MFNFNDNGIIVKDTTDPIVYSLDKIKWRLFTTLTFNQKTLCVPFKPKKIVAIEKTKILLNSLRGYFKISKRNYIFYCLYERNEANEIHLHLLISQKALKNINYFDLIEFITRKWDSLNDHVNVQKDIQLVDQKRIKQLTRYVSKRKASFREGINDLDYFIPKSFFREVISLSHN